MEFSKEAYHKILLSAHESKDINTYQRFALCTIFTIVNNVEYKSDIGIMDRVSTHWNVPESSETSNLLTVRLVGEYLTVYGSIDKNKRARIEILTNNGGLNFNRSISNVTLDSIKNLEYDIVTELLETTGLTIKDVKRELNSGKYRIVKNIDEQLTIFQSKYWEAQREVQADKTVNSESSREHEQFHTDCEGIIKAIRSGLTAPEELDRYVARLAMQAILSLPSRGITCKFTRHTESGAFACHIYNSDYIINIIIGDGQGFLKVSHTASGMRFSRTKELNFASAEYNLIDGLITKVKLSTNNSWMVPSIKLPNVEVTFTSMVNKLHPGEDTEALSKSTDGGQGVNPMTVQDRINEFKTIVMADKECDFGSKRDCYVQRMVFKFMENTNNHKHLSDSDIKAGLYVEIKGGWLCASVGLFKSGRTTLAIKHKASDRKIDSKVVDAIVRNGWDILTLLTTTPTLKVKDITKDAFKSLDTISNKSWASTKSNQVQYLRNVSQIKERFIDEIIESSTGELNHSNEFGLLILTLIAYYNGGDEFNVSVGDRYMTCTLTYDNYTLDVTYVNGRVKVKLKTNGGEDHTDVLHRLLNNRFNIIDAFRNNGKISPTDLVDILTLGKGGGMVLPMMLSNNRLVDILCERYGVEPNTLKGKCDVNTVESVLPDKDIPTEGKMVELKVQLLTHEYRAQTIRQPLSLEWLAFDRGLVQCPPEQDPYKLDYPTWSPLPSAYGKGTSYVNEHIRYSGMNVMPNKLPIKLVIPTPLGFITYDNTGESIRLNMPVNIAIAFFCKDVNMPLQSTEDEILTTLLGTGNTSSIVEHLCIMKEAFK